MLRWSVHDEQVCQAVQHVVEFEPAWTIGASWTKVRLRHLATAFGLEPIRNEGTLSSLFL